MSHFDNVVRKALRESIEEMSREWEPKFEAGNGPVGDDAPFEKGVNEEDAGKCPTCGKDGKECICKEGVETPVEDVINPTPDTNIEAEGDNSAEELSATGLPETNDWNLAPKDGESEVGESDPFGLNRDDVISDDEKAMLQEENNRFHSILNRISNLYD